MHRVGCVLAFSQEVVVLHVPSKTEGTVDLTCLVLRNQAASRSFPIVLQVQCGTVGGIDGGRVIGCWLRRARVEFAHVASMSHAGIMAPTSRASRVACLRTTAASLKLDVREHTSVTGTKLGLAVINNRLTTCAATRSLTTVWAIAMRCAG